MPSQLTAPSDSMEFRAADSAVDHEQQRLIHLIWFLNET
jgi:hypothetical protein